MASNCLGGMITPQRETISAALSPPSEGCQGSRKVRFHKVDLSVKNPGVFNWIEVRGVSGMGSEIHGNCSKQESTSFEVCIRTLSFWNKGILKDARTSSSIERGQRHSRSR